MKRILSTIGVGLAIVGAGITIPSAANASVDPSLVGTPISATPGTVETDGLNTCKTTRYYDTNTPGCRSLPIYSICGVWRTKTTCTRY